MTWARVDVHARLLVCARGVIRPAESVDVVGLVVDGIPRGLYFPGADLDRALRLADLPPVTVDDLAWLDP